MLEKKVSKSEGKNGINRSNPLLRKILAALLLFVMITDFTFNVVADENKNSSDSVKKAATFEDLLKNRQNKEEKEKTDGENVKQSQSESTSKPGTDNSLNSDSQSSLNKENDKNSQNTEESKDALNNKDKKSDNLNTEDKQQSEKKSPLSQKFSGKNITIEKADWPISFQEKNIKSRNFYAISVNGIDNKQEEDSTGKTNSDTKEKSDDQISTETGNKEELATSIEKVNTDIKVNNEHLLNITELSQKGENDLISTGAFNRLYITYSAYRLLKNRLNETYLVDREDWVKENEEISLLGIKKGTSWLIKDILKASLISDGADAHMLLADIISNSGENLLKVINTDLLSLGLNNTKIKDLYGEDKGGSITTAKELAIFMANFLSYADLKEWLSAKQIEIKSSENNSKFVLKNPFKELISASTFRGQELIDSGIASWNQNSQYSLLSYAPIADGYIIITSARAKDNYFRFLDHTSFYSSGLNKTHDYSLYKKGEKISELNVVGSLTKNIYINIANDVVLKLPEVAGKNQLNIKKNLLFNELKAPLAAGVKLGNIEVYYDGKLMYEEDFLLAQDIERIPLYRFNSFIYKIYNNNKPAFYLLQVFLLLLTIALIIFYNYTTDLKKYRQKKLQRMTNRIKK